MNLEKILKQISEASGVSGYEQEAAQIVKEHFQKYCDEIMEDPLGNIIGLKKGRGVNNKKIMLAAHVDEIGLMVKNIDDNGFIQFTNIGGVDQRTLLCQEVIIHGKEKTYGIIGAKPPHITNEEERRKALSIDDLAIDTGFTKNELTSRVNIGDVITIKRNMITLQNDWVAGKAMDDRAGIASLLVCLKELQHCNHEVDIYFVATVQEEVGARGATTSAYSINPDIGIAVDVGFGKTPELSQYETIEMGNGPAITVGPNIHSNIFDKIKQVAIQNYIDYQIEVAPGHSGTDAWPMQVSRSGIATGVLSIPLRYMHTSVETLSLSDIKKTGKLLANFIVSLNEIDMEELLCY
ncbi:M42 family metallopeptidase [Alkaliphilus sp. B6464]|uniref:M42 family metallopeptidase n=1 Tax=Alkaliphilus sp. B6464 TaxID=2731219 RepID=UPI001BADAE61|nr:M42 family metallopeptidase [Alkaliphilus sp. B6464]QUH20752.1 M42 family metallopeptidase [Alkaliphilus sp. B6464]